MQDDDGGAGGEEEENEKDDSAGKGGGHGEWVEEAHGLARRSFTGWYNGWGGRRDYVVLISDFIKVDDIWAWCFDVVDVC